MYTSIANEAVPILTSIQFHSLHGRQRASKRIGCTEQSRIPKGIQHSKVEVRISPPLVVSMFFGLPNDFPDDSAFLVRLFCVYPLDPSLWMVCLFVRI